jgi:subtilisin family serine protease
MRVRESHEDAIEMGQVVRVVTTPGDYRFGYGTSFAAPHVAGAVALLRSLAPDARPATIRNVMEMAAEKLPTPTPGPRRRAARH